ncbi:unnamed protein product [Paramecium pentaurelia]|uniref:Ubiquitin-like protease family profile domain-containing protein n=1 Tax=Paramecium pentaurelia TaxID=43138 RepID=A0A8S1VRI3_9CILI|nr:unnamed protein product [Paramecium pentaurelia]
MLINFQILITIFLILVIYFLIKERLINFYNKYKAVFKKITDDYQDEIANNIQYIKDQFVKKFQKKNSTLLPSYTQKPTQPNFIIRHYEDFLVGQQQNLSYQIKCKDREILYGQFLYKNLEAYTGKGFQYKVSYDSNFNPIYELYEGEFKNGLKHGQGKLFGQKSENVIQEGEWQEDELKQNQNNDQNNNQKLQQNDDHPRNFKIIIKDGDKIIKSNIKIRENQRKIEQWIKFNQLISQNDIKILKSKNRWFTSSIIDSFVLYLNIQIDEKYFKIDFNQRKQALRQIFVPSYVFTQMKNNTKDINIQIFQNHFLEYKRIDYQIEKIYNRINFIVNRNNTHWFLIQLNLKNYQMIIMDSIINKEESYNNFKDILNTIFQQQITKIVISDQCIHQNNGYDCGPYTCLNMLKLSEIQLKLETPSEIRKFLLEQLKQN